MLNLLTPSFPHRRNADESYDSICAKCFVTVANVQNEWELARHESAHNCNPWDLSWYSSGVSVPCKYRAAIFS